MALVGAIGCNDTAVVLRISGDGTLDSMCVELDAGGAARFGRRYDLTRTPLPQTLTAVAESRDQMQVLATGIQRGQPQVRDRRQIAFRSGQVLEADLSLAACLPVRAAPVEVSFNSVATVSGAVDRALLLPAASGVGAVAVAFGAGQAARYSASATALTLAGGIDRRARCRRCRVERRRSRRRLPRRSAALADGSRAVAVAARGRRNFRRALRPWRRPRARSSPPEISTVTELRPGGGGGRRSAPLPQ